MVSGDEQRIAHLFRRRNDFTEAAIHALDRLNGGRHHTRVADHVTVGKVTDDHVIHTGTDAHHELVLDLDGAHLGDEVVGRKFARRRDEHAILAGILRLRAAVEEERDMCVLFRFRDAQLAQTVCADDLAERVVQLLGRECDRKIGELLVVARRADIVQVLRNDLAPEAVKIALRERIGHFPGTVGTEVHEDDAVAGPDLSVRSADDGLDKFVRHTGGIARLHRVDGVGILHAFAADHSVVARLNAVPALVTVHAVKASLQRCDLARAELGAIVTQLADIARAARGRNVTPVEEAVQVDTLDAAVMRHLHHGEDVPDVAVYAAVGQQTEDVQRLTVCGVIKRRAINGVFKKRAVGNGVSDARKILKHDAA